LPIIYNIRVKLSEDFLKEIPRVSIKNSMREISDFPDTKESQVFHVFPRNRYLVIINFNYTE